MQNIEDIKKKLKKVERVHKQRKEWADLEKTGGIVKAWQKKSLKNK